MTCLCYKCEYNQDGCCLHLDYVIIDENGECGSQLVFSKTDGDEEK